MTGRFNRLNEALFAQMEKLQECDLSDAAMAERIIEQSRTVSKLAGGIIANANTAMRLMSLKASSDMELAESVGDHGSLFAPTAAPLMIEEGGDRKPVRTEAEMEWLKANAPSHTVSYLADRLGWPRAEVNEALAELGASAKVLDGKPDRTWRQENDDSWRKREMAS